MTYQKLKTTKLSSEIVTPDELSLYSNSLEDRSNISYNIDGNLTSFATLISAGYYIDTIQASTKKPHYSKNDSFSTYMLPVSKNTDFYSVRYVKTSGNSLTSSMRFLTLLNEDKDTCYSTTISTYVKKFNSEQASYALFSIPEQLSDFYIGRLYSSFDANLNHVYDISKMAVNCKENLMSYATKIKDDTYIIIGSQKSDNTPYVSQNASFDIYSLPILKNTTYCFNNIYSVLFVDNTLNNCIANVSYDGNCLSANSGNATYALLCIKKVNFNVAYVRKTAEDGDVQISGYAKAHVDKLSSNSMLNLTNAYTAAIDGDEVIADFRINDVFDSIVLGRMTTGNTPFNQISVDNRSICFSDLTGNVISSFAHGLELSNCINLRVHQNIENVDVVLMSNGEWYKCTCSYSGNKIGQYYLSSVNCELSDCSLTYTNRYFNSDIWIFGDSYVSFTNKERWTYYLVQDGYNENVLILGNPGINGSSGQGYTLLNCLTNFAKPKMCVWTYGINSQKDPDDDTPNSAYVSNATQFIKLCRSRGIEPVIATVPNIQVFSEYGSSKAKNKWIRESGLRYVDFEKAVGSDMSNTWYSGMQNSDKVHPTENGAKALYARFLMDIPEVTRS